MKYIFAMHSKQQGFSLPMAVFVIVIMAVIGTAAVSVLTTGQRSSADQIIATRSLYSAESGAQWVLSQLFPLDGSPANCLNSYPGLNFNATGIAGCSASTSCSSATVSGKTYYTIDSTGRCDFSSSSASRRIQILAAAP